jgi:hypothetical protein
VDVCSAGVEFALVAGGPPVEEVEGTLVVPVLAPLTFVEGVVAKAVPPLSEFVSEFPAVEFPSEPPGGRLEGELPAADVAEKPKLVAPAPPMLIVGT